MSLALLEHEIKRFLSVDAPEVICVRGKWGVGKTFAWNRYLAAARDAQAIKLDRYSYVSLFGIGSLDELRYSIFENTVRSSDIGTDPSLESLNKNASAATERFGRKSLWFLQQLPFVKNHIGGLGPVWYLSVKKYLICLDDIERKGNGLPIRDVFGLVSQLKEQKQCKIVLILNDDALGSERIDFDSYFDKTIDTSFTFAPTAQDAAAIALVEEEPGSTLVAENCNRLGISNIRVIRRIQRMVGTVFPLLQAYDPQVFSSAAHTLTLLGWSRYEPDIAPPFEFIKNRHKRLWSQTIAKLNKEKEEQLSDDEVRWNSILDAYNFGGVDELDLVLEAGIAQGFFNPEDLQTPAIALDQRAKAGKSEEKAGQGWRLFHDSFANNEQEILTMMTDGVRDNFKYLSPMNFNGTIGFLRQLGYEVESQNLIDEYLESHADNADFFDLSKYPFAREITDIPLREAFNKKLESLRGKITIEEAFDKFAKNGRGSENDLEIMANFSIEEYLQNPQNAIW